MTRAEYSRWDGTQDFDELDGDGVLRQLMDELLEHGDPDQALRRLMQQGFGDGPGRRVSGLRELLQRARQRRAKMARDAFGQLQSAISGVSPEALAQSRQMLSELNDMVERQQAGQDVEDRFQAFKSRWGPMLPGDPGTLAELLAALAERMAHARAMLEALTPEQRAKLAELSEAMLQDEEGLNYELDRLAANLAGLPGFGPGGPLDDPFGELSGIPNELASLNLGSLGLGQGGSPLGDLSDLDQLEQLLAGAPSPGALAEVDLDRARQLLGEEDARSIEALGKLAAQLKEAGLAQQKEGRLRLTPKGLRRIGDQALSDLYTKLTRYRAGQHAVGHPGPGHERSGETKPYEWGDPFNLSIYQTVRNAVTRNGPGTPVRLQEADFEVERTEALSRSATVIMLDLSLSMPMRGNFVAAKKMTMALHSLISGRFPNDYLGIVGFARYGREISLAELPEVSWDYDWGTNIQHGLALSRQLLARQRGTRQVIMVTDGEPTAHWPTGAPAPVFSYPPTQETVDATLAEVARCGREGVRINTFALDATGHLRHFVQQMARLNRGKAFFTSPSTLGDYVLLDFLEGRTASSRRRSRRAG